MHVIVSFSFCIFLAMNLVALQMPSRPQFKLRVTCEPWQTNSPQHAYRSVPETVKWKLIYVYTHICCFKVYVLLYKLESVRGRQNLKCRRKIVPEAKLEKKKCKQIPYNVSRTMASLGSGYCASKNHKWHMSMLATAVAREHFHTAVSLWSNIWIGI